MCGPEAMRGMGGASARPRDYLADILAGHEGEAIAAMGKSFGSPDRFNKYLGRVAPSQNIEFAPHIYYPPREPVMSEDEQVQHLVEMEDREITSPLYKPEYDGIQPVASFVSGIFKRPAQGYL